MPKENKIKVSVRLDPDNYDLIRAIADTCFMNEDDVEGNFSEAMNFLLNIMRTESWYSDTLHYLLLRGRYLRGDRSEEVLSGMKSFERILIMNRMRQVTE
jgi:hypothetical protein